MTTKITTIATEAKITTIATEDGGWGSSGHNGASGVFANDVGGWGQAIAADREAAKEVRSFVKELLRSFTANSCPGLTKHISEFVGNRLIG